MKLATQSFRDRYQLIREELTPGLCRQLDAFVEHIEYFDENGWGNEFNSLVVNLGRAYPDDREKVFALFSETDPYWKKRLEPPHVHKKVTYSPKTEKEPCIGCDPEPLTYAQHKALEAEKERSALAQRLKELGFVNSVEATSTDIEEPENAVQGESE